MPYYNYTKVTPDKKYSIDYQGLTLGKHNFEFDVTDDLFAMYEESEVRSGSLRVSIELNKHSSMMELEIEITGTVEVECDRCLDPLSLPIDYNGHLIVKISNETGLYDGDIMWLHPSDNILSLAQYLYESVILSLPYQRLHETLDACNADMVKRFAIIEQEIE